jgi:hypothetical protein
MRYHKAIAVNKAEANFIIGSGSAALSDTVVVSRGAQYYDVRGMTQSEIEAFVADLARAEHAETEAKAALLC